MDLKYNQKIIKQTYFTILYLNCINYPPTTFEVWNHFLDVSKTFKSVSFGEVLSSLETLKNKKKISNKNSFWVVNDKLFLAEQRIIRQKSSLLKIKNLIKWAHLIRFLPFVRGIFLAGTLAFQNSSQDSDWDVLVVFKKDRIWLGRLILTVVLFITGQKRTKFKIKNRFCLNHFLTDNNLIPQERNEYTACEYGFILPVLGGKLFVNFMQLNWNWSRQFCPNFEASRSLEEGFLVDENWSKKVRHLFEISLEVFGVAGFLNQQCKRLMIRRIEKNPETFKKGAVIIYNDGELAFWPDFKNLQKIVKI